MTDLTNTRLALAFINVLREWLTADEFKEMQHLQRTQPMAGVCHSHDHCDANMAMDAAFRNVLGRGFHMSSDVEEGKCTQQDHERDFLRWDTAWELAKGAVFDPSPIIRGAGYGRHVLTRHESGAYTFEHEGTAIHNPCLSDCGRFWQSPADRGFTLHNTGGNCQAWRRDFQLEDGTPVYMLVTDTDGGLPDETDARVCVGVYYELTEGWIQWTVDDSALDDEHPAEFTAEGWTHGLAIPDPTARQHLTAIYEQWCAKHGMPAVSADEQVAATAEQATWLGAFITLWDAAA